MLLGLLGKRRWKPLPPCNSQGWRSKMKIRISKEKSKNREPFNAFCFKIIKSSSRTFSQRQTADIPGAKKGEQRDRVRRVTHTKQRKNRAKHRQSCQNHDENGISYNIISIERRKRGKVSQKVMSDEGATRSAVNKGTSSKRRTLATANQVSSSDT